jgi:hypothetical protein
MVDSHVSKRVDAGSAVGRAFNRKNLVGTKDDFGSGFSPSIG